MPIAILIGFEYGINKLPGVTIDLYHCYKWCKTFNCDINILSDASPPKNTIIHRALRDKLVDFDVSNFYGKIENRYKVNTKLDLTRSIKDILSNNIIDNKLIIYYTGHGVENEIILPDESLLSLDELKRNMISVINSTVEIFWILDCCNPSGMKLPYKLEDNKFTLSTPNVEFIKNPMLLITSSETHEKSVSTVYGSLFSKYLFKILTCMNNTKINYDGIVTTKHNRNLQRLTTTLTSEMRRANSGYSQTVSIYSSYVTDPVLWIWIGSNRDYDVVIDSSLSVLYIRPY